MMGVTSGWHVFEADANGFPLILQVYGTEPFNKLLEQTLIRHREAGGVDPIDNLRVGLHPSVTALKEEAYETVKTHLCLQSRTEHDHEGPQCVFQQQGSHRHDRLLPDIAIRPLPRWPQGVGLFSQLVVLVLGSLPRLCELRHGALTLCETFAVPLSFGLGHVGLCHLACFGLLVDSLARRLQRLLTLLSRTLLMPVGTNQLLAAIVGSERAMVDQALAAVFLSLVALPVHPRPRGRLQNVCDLGRTPRDQGHRRFGGGR